MAAPSKPRAGSIVVPKMTEPSTKNEQKVDQGEPANDIWTTERQLVSSLAKLQELETMTHQLRTLLPDRLLEPLVPIVNPRAVAQGRSVPKSPQMLYEQLSQTARGGVAEVANFQNMWRGPEMKAIWDHVDAKIQEDRGQLLQPTGVWERDYDILLEKLVEEDETKKEEQERAEEEMERSRVDQSADGDWRKVVEGFIQRNVPGVHVVPSKDKDAVTVSLVKAGMTFQAQVIGASGEDGVPKWQVLNNVSLGKHKTKLESAICDCLNARPRQWDLSFLLDMISSYSSIKQTPCVKCNQITDTTVQLPTICRPKHGQSSPEGQRTFTWEAFHPSCV